MQTEVETLKKKLAEAQIEIAALRLQVTNLTFMLKREMRASGSLPNLVPAKTSPLSN